MSGRAVAKKGTKEVKKVGPVTLVTSINLHKRLHGVTFKNRAPRAVREIKKFAAALLNTKDVRIDTDVNRYVWNKGIRNVPFRIRVKLSRRRSEEEDAKEQFYTLVEVEDVDTFKGATTKKVAADEE